MSLKVDKSIFIENLLKQFNKFSNLKLKEKQKPNPVLFSTWIGINLLKHIKFRHSVSRRQLHEFFSKSTVPTYNISKSSIDKSISTLCGQGLIKIEQSCGQDFIILKYENIFTCNMVDYNLFIVNIDDLQQYGKNFYYFMIGKYLHLVFTYLEPNKISIHRISHSTFKNQLKLTRNEILKVSQCSGMNIGDNDFEVKGYVRYMLSQGDINIRLYNKNYLKAPLKYWFTEPLDIFNYFRNVKTDWVKEKLSELVYVCKQPETKIYKEKHYVETETISHEGENIDKWIFEHLTHFTKWRLAEKQGFYPSPYLSSDDYSVLSKIVHEAIWLNGKNEICIEGIIPIHRKQLLINYIRMLYYLFDLKFLNDENIKFIDKYDVTYYNNYQDALKTYQNLKDDMYNTKKYTKIFYNNNKNNEKDYNLEKYEKNKETVTVSNVSRIELEKIIPADDCVTSGNYQDSILYTSSLENKYIFGKISEYLGKNNVTSVKRYVSGPTLAIS